jgi:hypothetical protein
MTLFFPGKLYPSSSPRHSHSRTPTERAHGVREHESFNPNPDPNLEAGSAEAEVEAEGEMEYDELEEEEPHHIPHRLYPSSTSHPRAHASHHAGPRSGSRSISPAEILSGGRPNLPAGEKIPQCVRCVKAGQKCTIGTGASCLRCRAMHQSCSLVAGKGGVEGVPSESHALFCVARGFDLTDNDVRRERQKSKDGAATSTTRLWRWYADSRRP